MTVETYIVFNPKAAVLTSIFQCFGTFRMIKLNLWKAWETLVAWAKR